MDLQNRYSARFLRYHGGWLKILPRHCVFNQGSLTPPRAGKEIEIMSHVAKCPCCQKTKELVGYCGGLACVECIEWNEEMLADDEEVSE